MMSIPTKSTALVVGAGPSGLVALKEMKEAGIVAIAVDSASDFGGVFSPASGMTYDELYLTTTNMFMAYSDFPPKDENVKYWSKQEYYEYMSSYVEHFNFRSSIHLETSVVKAKLISDAWHVTFKTKAGELLERIFDYMVVATGANHTPHLPKIFQGFKGEILHSHQYHSQEQVKGKKVLVIGMGESSADVVKSSAKTAETVTLWTRHYPNVAPRFLGECIDDKNYSEDEYLPQQDSKDRRPGEFLETVLTSRIVRNMPLAAWATVLQKGLFADLKVAHGSKSAAGLMSDWCLNSYKKDFFSGDTASVPTKTIMICTTAANKQMEMVVAPRMRCESNRVVFEEPLYRGLEKLDNTDDIPIDIDVIVACTGYKVSFDWIEAPGLDSNPRFWFKHCIPTSGNLGKKLAFIGYARPHQGGIPQCAEILSRYISQLVLKTKTLPDNYKDLAQAEGKCENECFYISKHIAPLVDYPAFMLSVSRLVGCEPVVPQDVSGIVKYWTFPLWSCFFRTQGIGAKPEMCEAILNKFGTFDAVAPMPLAAVQVILTFFMPVLNFCSFVFELFFEKQRKGIPAGYKFRSSKMNFMSGNCLRLKDFGAPVLAQWIAAAAMILHGVGSLFPTPSSDKKFSSTPPPPTPYSGATQILTPKVPTPLLGAQFHPDLSSSILSLCP